jgi:hypothetical protein
MDIVICQEQNNNDNNKCLCEKKLFGNTDKHCNRSLKEWCDFRVYCYANEDYYCYTILCFPITFTFKSIFTLPCACYNECRNGCNKTKNKNYIC